MTAAAAIESSTPAAPLTLVSDICDQPRTFEQALHDQFHVDFCAWQGDYATPEQEGKWVRLAEFERNGYNDSDWYSLILHVPTGTLMTQGTGTTRFAAPPTMYDGFFGRVTEEHLEVARQKWAEQAARVLVEIDTRNCTAPSVELFKQAGVEVTTLRAAHVGTKTVERRTCPKCEGSGAKGRYKCGYCKGVGHFDNVHNCKGEGGAVKAKVAAGARGVTLEPCVSRGTFYRDGYNKPDRGNSRVLVRLESGEIVTLGLDALRLTREPATYADKLAEMIASAKTLNLGDMRWFRPYGYFPF